MRTIKNVLVRCAQMRAALATLLKNHKENSKGYAQRAALESPRPGYWHVSTCQWVAGVKVARSEDQSVPIPPHRGGFVILLERLVRPVAIRWSLGLLAHAQGHFFRFIDGKLDRFEPSSLMGPVTEWLVPRSSA